MVPYPLRPPRHSQDPETSGRGPSPRTTAGHTVFPAGAGPRDGSTLPGAPLRLGVLSVGATPLAPQLHTEAHHGPAFQRARPSGLTPAPT